MRADFLDLLVCPRTGGRLVTETLVRHGDDIEYGILSSEGGRYPVVSGIPIFLPGHDAVLDSVEAGRYEQATAEAVLVAAPSRTTRLATGLGGRGRVGRCATTVAAVRRRWDSSQQAARMFDTPERRLSFDVVGDIYRASGARSPDAYNYFRYRFGIPRHLVGLSFIEAVPIGGLVLDLGCGAGHLTWSLAEHHGRDAVVGVDSTYFLLLAAYGLAPGGSFVCADATNLPFRADRFSIVFSSDVLSYVTDKTAALREIERVLEPPGTIILTSVRNRLCEHVFGGSALSPGGWNDLVDHLPHRLFDDKSVLDRYLEGIGIPGEGSSLFDLAAAQTISIVATMGTPDLPSGGRFADWPHARGSLAVNPLFAVAFSGPDEVRYEVRLPSPTYEKDNATMLSYLPERFALSRQVLTSARQGHRPPALEPLIASVAVLALPDHYVHERWPDD